jgi:hypothetical protein
MITIKLKIKRRNNNLTTHLWESTNGIKKERRGTSWRYYISLANLYTVSPVR